MIGLSVKVIEQGTEVNLHLSLIMAYKRTTMRLDNRRQGSSIEPGIADPAWQLVVPHAIVAYMQTVNQPNTRRQIDKESNLNLTSKELTVLLCQVRNSISISKRELSTSWLRSILHASTSQRKSISK